MARPRHPKKDVEGALSSSEGAGVTVESKSAGHGWGLVVCSCSERMSVWSTPKNPGNFARKIERFVA